MPFLAAAWAVLPVAPSAGELTHRELDAAWHAVRPVFEAQAAWSLWAAWADAQGESVELSLIERRPVSAAVVRGAPSPYVRHPMQRVDAEDAEAAAEAMEALRAQAVAREEAGRRAHSQALSDADRRAHEAALAAIDQRTREYAAEQEARL